MWGAGLDLSGHATVRKQKCPDRLWCPRSIVPRRPYLIFDLAIEIRAAYPHLQDRIGPVTSPWCCSSARTVWYCSDESPSVRSDVGWITPCLAMPCRQFVYPGWGQYGCRGDGVSCWLLVTKDNFSQGHIFQRWDDACILG